MSDKTQEAPFGTAIGTCDKCDGQGEFLDLRHGIVRCDKCAGAGKIEYVLGIGDAYVQQQQRIEALEALVEAKNETIAQQELVIRKVSADFDVWYARGGIAEDALREIRDKQVWGPVLDLEYNHTQTLQEFIDKLRDIARNALEGGGE